jgi:hypothetical protein
MADFTLEHEAIEGWHLLSRFCERSKEWIQGIWITMLEEFLFMLFGRFDKMPITRWSRGIEIDF